MSYILRYRTFDQLLAEAAIDFPNYDNMDLIAPAQLIKVAKRVNYELGLKIFQTKEIVLEVEKGRAKLPDNFYVLNFAMMCGAYETKQYMPQGTWVEERPIEPQPYNKPGPEVIDTCKPEPKPIIECPPCNKCGTACVDDCVDCSGTQPRLCEINCKGETYELIQKLNYTTRTYSFLRPIKILDQTRDIDCDCPNLYWNSPDTAWIKDGYIYTNFQEGNLYLNYQGMMEDDEGNLLVVDHDLLNEYYEYAVKQRILENLILNDVTVSQLKIQLIEKGFTTSRRNAISLVRMPDYGDIKKIHEVNRKAQYNKYYNMFRTFPGRNIESGFRNGLR
tara:strand:- start:269 stop:1267 length:999 start_codon:yes stop_codon:yes gene_type:complete